MTTVHGACVMIAGIGVLLRGPSGCGKSDLALRLIDEGAVLVADDQVTLKRDGEALTASAPAVLAGLIEARGVGLLHVPAAAEARLALIVDLVDSPAVERMPEPDDVEMLDATLPRLRLAPFEASTPAKLRLAAKAAAAGALFQTPPDPQPGPQPGRPLYAASPSAFSPSVRASSA